MALEYKKIECESEATENVITFMLRFGWKLQNSTRIYNATSTPRGGFAYENLFYIHSEKECEDFTELLFVRDKNIPDYDRIIELEEEALDLLPFFTERPPVTSPLMAFEEWVKTEPSKIFHFKEKLAQFFKVYVSSFIAFILIGAIISKELVPYVFMFTIVFFTPIVLLGVKIHDTITFHKTIKKPASKYYDRIYSRYVQYKELNEEEVNNLKMYYIAAKRIPEIFREVSLYVD